MKRVVITGIGVKWPNARDYQEAVAAFRARRTGFRVNPEYAAKGFSCQVSGSNPDFSFDPKCLRKQARRFAKGELLQLGLSAAKQAVADSGLTAEEIAGCDTGVCVSTGGVDLDEYQEIEAKINTNAALAPEKRRPMSRVVGPFEVPAIMTSGAAAVIAVELQAQNFTGGLVAACSSGLLSVGEAYDKIRLGRAKRMAAGGGDLDSPRFAVGFDAMQALDVSHNDDPERACRPASVDRGGFILSKGFTVLILEEYETAIARNARIYAEIVGYGAMSDGDDMAVPNPAGQESSIRAALQDIDPKKIKLVILHATGTKDGLNAETTAMASVFGRKGTEGPTFEVPKELLGHMLAGSGPAGVVSGIIFYRENFTLGPAPGTTVDSVMEGLHLSDGTEPCPEGLVLINSNAFGGSNGTLVLRVLRP